jgi:hypothetical protein
MYWYHYIALASSGIFLANFSYHLIKLIRLGKPHDYAPSAGMTGPAILYSFTGAMSPVKKESAFLHLPSYTAGIIYHLGSFLSILLFILKWFIDISFGLLSGFLAILLFISVCCGIGILIKRIISINLKNLSNPDDYLSNILVTSFQLSTALVLIMDSFTPVYYIISALLLLYFPLSKLKHVIYFFAARYHLGFFYGWRGVWPPKQL